MEKKEMRSSISKIVYRNIKDFVEGRAYPIVAELTTKKPFIVYKIDTQRPDYTKDGIFEWMHSVNIKIVCDSYDDLLSIADDVIFAFDEDEDIEDTLVSQVTEDYIDDEYVCDVDVQLYT